MSLTDYVTKQHLLYTTRKNNLKAVEIETTTICNRKCNYCPNSTITRPQKTMDINIYYKIIDSLAEMGFKGRLSPHFYGEPLTDDRLPDLIKYTRDKLPDVQIKLFTNGDLLTLDKYQELCSAGVDIFRVSQHSLMPGKNIKELKKYTINNKNHIPVEFINYFTEYYDKRNSDNVLMNRGGIIPSIEIKKKTYCLYVNQLTFDYLGNAVLCCNDFLSSVKFGNINDSSVSDIWYDVNYIKARRKIISGKWIFNICEKCNTNPEIKQIVLPLPKSEYPSR